MHELQGVNERIKRQEERGGEMFFVETNDAGRRTDDR